MAGDGKLPSHDANVTIQVPDRIHMCRRDAHDLRGQTLSVPRREVPVHLLLGDRIGVCDRG
jgi:hypothetical protein